MKNTFRIQLFAILFSVTTLIFGYMAFGQLVSLIFAAGYIGGLLLWILKKDNHVSFTALKRPFWLTWAAFILLHKVEENRSKFFETVSQITGVPVPTIGSFSLTMLLLIGVMPWLFVPLLMKRRHPLGAYFAWTFFSCMGITELAHFLVFPFLREGPYRYFPGMASVLVLAPIAWWGMWRLFFNKTSEQN